MVQDLDKQNSPVFEYTSAGPTLGWIKDYGSELNIADTRVAATGTTITLSTNFILTSGYTTAGDGGGALYIRASGSTTGGFQSLDGQWWKLAAQDYNIKMFGAVGDGVTDNSVAITAASNFINAIGGRMRVPAGHYLNTALITSTSSIAIGNNVEWSGDGFASFLDFKDNCFKAPSGGISRNMIGSLTKYPANAVTAGAQSVTTTTAGNAANFAAGDIIMIWSTTGVVMTVPDSEPYWTENNRVVSVNAGTGVIQLEDQIEDGWTAGAQVSNVTQFFAQNYHIHDLRLKGDFPSGSRGIAIWASYKAIIENCWMEGAELLSVNAFVRSVIRDCFATIYYSNNFTEAVRVYEPATGSVRPWMDACVVELVSYDGTASPGTAALIYINEYVRRAKMTNCDIIGPAFDSAYPIFIADSQAEEIDGIYMHLKSASECIRVPSFTGDAAIQNKPMVCRNVDILLEGTVTSFITCGISNATFESCKLLGGTPTNAIVSGQNISGQTFRGIKSPGLVWAPFSTITDVLVHDSEVGIPADLFTLNLIEFRDCHRYGAANLPPKQVTYSSEASVTPGHQVLLYTMVANDPVAQGDFFEITCYVVKLGAAGAGNLKLSAFTNAIFTATTPATNNTTIVVHCRIYLVQGTFSAPTAYYASGYYIIGDTLTHILTTGVFDPTLANAIELQAWSASAPDTLGINNLRIAFENGQQQ